MNTPQLRELFIAYGLTAGAMLIGLLLMRADRRAYFRWPVYSVMVMALGVVSWNLLRKHLMPWEWGVTHARLMYYWALALYSVLGLGVGLMLGRLTRRLPPAPQEDPAVTALPVPGRETGKTQTKENE